MVVDDAGDDVGEVTVRFEAVSLQVSMSDAITSEWDASGGDRREPAEELFAI